MIEVEGLTKVFKTGRDKSLTAVDHVNFSVKKGEIFGLLGPNGAGKSTTLRMLSTLAKPSEGSAKIGGFDIVKNDNAVRKLIGIVSEKMIVYDQLTAKENLWFFGSLYRLPKDKMNKRIDELLELVNLTEFKNVQSGTFSTGMRQRMNVIRALLNEPQVLFLDEPTLGLDPQSSVEIREFIKKLNRDSGVTIIVTTHMMVDANILCDRIAIMDYGKIVALDTSANLKKATKGADTLIINMEIANLNLEMIDKVKCISGVDAVNQETDNKLRIIVHGENAFEEIHDSIRNMNGKISSMENLQPTLEDVFLHMTGHTVRDSVGVKADMPQKRGYMSVRRGMR